MKYPSIARLRPPDPACKIYNSLDDMASGCHDLQYFEMFCNVGVGKANRFNGNQLGCRPDLVRRGTNTRVQTRST